MKKNTRSAGFTLVEMLVSIAIFLVVGGVALGLVARSMPLYNKQQNTSSLNIALRSAVAQMEQDVVNAGTGYYVGVNFPDWPVGVTVINNTGGSCYNATTKVYGANCFDKMNIITTDLTTPPANLNASALSNNTTVDVKVPTVTDPATGSPWTAANFAAKFLSGDQVLMLNSGGTQMTTFKLTANATVQSASPGVIRLTHTATNSNGTNGSGAGSSSTACTQTTTPANDPMDITRCWSTKLGNSYFMNNDWVMKMAATTYQVDTSTATNPKLVRVVGGTSNVVAEQIIGFKVGAALWNNWNGTDDYRFDAAKYPSLSDTSGLADPTLKDPFNFTRVRSVRISLIGRTTPVTDPTYTFRNTFDSGPYQIQAASVVVNPRNLSMKDQ